MKYKLFLTFFILAIALISQTLSHTTVTGGGGSGALTLISKQVIAVPTNTITFSSIPGTYTNLTIYISARCDDTSNVDDVYMQFNGDTGNNYSRTYYGANDTGAFQGNGISQATIPIMDIPCANASAGAAGAGTINIPNYAGIFWKNYLSQIGFLNAIGSQTSANIGALWANTGAITQIVIGNTTTPAANFIVGSTFTLYGMQ